MVAGKVKAAMGFQRSPAVPKAETGRWTSSASVSHKSSPGSAGQLSPPTPLASSNPKTAAAFARSFGVYFPRASAQVQPRPPDVDELLRLVEELRETESSLRAQLLEQKTLSENVAVVPYLEKEIAEKNDELALAGELIRRLEAEKRALRDEVEGLSFMLRSGEEEGRRREKVIADLEAKLEELRKTVLEHGIRESRPVVEGEVDGRSSSQRLQGLIDASVRSNLLKNLRKGPKSADIAGDDQDAQKSAGGDVKADETKAEEVHPERRRCEKEEVFDPRVPRVPKPPPARTISSNSSISSSPSSCSSSETTHIIATSKGPKLAALPPIPPPTPPAGPSSNAGVRPPPPPPPPPKRGSRSAAASVRRVPEVVEFYHSLMRRDSKRETSGGGQEAAPVVAASNPRDMIGEIENRSSHLLAIKTDVETQGDFIKLLIKEVEHAVFSNIEDVVAFVKWLDDELSFLVDERAVLKHFNWPEHKVDAMREAAFGYCDLKKLESEASSFQDDPRQLCSPSLKKMKALLEKLEQGVYNLSRLQENATHRYKRFSVPCEWMQENGCVSQIKLASVKLAMKYMKRVSTELQVIAGSLEEEELMLQGVRFAFRVHQFAGGFDVETMRAFQELKDKARVLLLQSQNQNQQKLYSGLQIGRFAAKQPIL
ncbi:protein INCREASED PETAL GROWTH ANISOTROPY 1-like [Curcuma longa]|uniref:protein INCREASED PETAL GROWTH ANISOTROPY 1-like n=1 Tax=Curcuma longa TaxID=136217 RepID=UPI003D9F0FF5